MCRCREMHRCRNCSRKSIAAAWRNSMPPEKYRYIVVEGPIGAGKTSLARKLSAHLGKSLLLEDPDSNPFLARFYEDPRRHALATQLFFLVQRAQQVGGLKQIDLVECSTV